MTNYFNNLPNDLQNYIYKQYFTHYVINNAITIANKQYFTKYVVPCLNHKDWWYHTVKCRANKDIYYTQVPYFIDAETIHFSAHIQNYFSYS